MQPSDIKRRPVASQCGSAEGEQVAMNIMKILAVTSNSFHKITWPEYIHQRLFDGATAEDLDEEKPYFDRVIQYFENEATVRLFSEEWNLPIPEYEKPTVSDQGKEAIPLSYDEIYDEREALFQAFDAIRKLFKGRHWIMEGRGAYPYDDERYKEEVRYIMDEFETINNNLWKQIKSKSFEYKEKLRKEILSEQPDTAPTVRDELIKFVPYLFDYVGRNYFKTFGTNEQIVDEYLSSAANQPKETV